MNKTQKLFCAAILLLSVACKDAPMTEPSPIRGLEYAYDSANSKWTLDIEGLAQPLEIPIVFDSCGFQKHNGDGLNEKYPEHVQFVAAAVNHQDEMYLCTKSVNIEMFASPVTNFNIKTDRGYIIQNQASGKLGYSLSQKGLKKEILPQEYDHILEITATTTNQAWIIAHKPNEAVKIIAFD